jgi:hypothetical protein
MPETTSTEAREALSTYPDTAAPSPQPRPAPGPALIPEPSVELKHFVLDTNVLLHNPNALFVFQEHEVIIPFAVIEELDKLKRQNDDIGRNARETIRHLDRLRLRGRLIEGVPWGAHHRPQHLRRRGRR